MLTKDVLPIKRTKFFCYIILLITIISLCNSDILSAGGTLVWDSPPPQNLAGYKVYYGKASRNYETGIDVFTQTCFPLDDLAIGETYYLAVTAYDFYSRESAYSNEVQYTNDIIGNQPPIAVDDSIAINGDTPVSINVIANDIDHDGNVDPFTVVILSFAANGMLVNNWDGTITYTPQSGYSGVDTFRYTVRDNFGSTSNEATVSVMVTP
ncbi:MAG: Ig-like domain-containing protein [Candidatus Scalindua sp.]|nr:Ig-like domain-containing protein [Candidatus Scalindua sp.]